MGSRAACSYGAQPRIHRKKKKSCREKLQGRLSQSFSRRFQNASTTMATTVTSSLAAQNKHLENRKNHVLKNSMKIGIGNNCSIGVHKFISGERSRHTQGRRSGRLVRREPSAGSHPQGASAGAVRRECPQGGSAGTVRRGRPQGNDYNYCIFGERPLRTSPADGPCGQPLRTTLVDTPCGRSLRTLSANALFEHSYSVIRSHAAMMTPAEPLLNRGRPTD